MVSPESIVVSLVLLMVHWCRDGLACVGLVLQVAELVECVVMLESLTECSECLTDVDPSGCPLRIALVCHPCIQSGFLIAEQMEPSLVLLADCCREQWKVVGGRRLCSWIVVLVVSPQSKRPKVVVVVLVR